MTATSLTYTCEAPGFGGCGHRHKTFEAAQTCLDEAIRRYRRIPGGNTYCPWRVIALDTAGRRVPHEWEADA